MGVQRPVQFAVFVGVARERVSLVVGSLQKLGVLLVGEAERCVDGGAAAVAVPFLVFFLVIIVKAVILDKFFLDVVFPLVPGFLDQVDPAVAALVSSPVTDRLLLDNLVAVQLLVGIALPGV